MNPPLTVLSEEEEIFRKTVRDFATQEIINFYSNLLGFINPELYFSGWVKWIGEVLFELERFWFI